MQRFINYQGINRKWKDKHRRSLKQKTVIIGQIPVKSDARIWKSEIRAIISKKLKFIIDIKAAAILVTLQRPQGREKFHRKVAHRL
jgi:hypothetical protein